MPLLAAGFVSLALTAGMAEYFQRLAFANFANRSVNDARSAANARVSRRDTASSADLAAQVLADSARVKQGLKGVLNHIVLKRLHAIVETVRTGDPFVSANADRLRAIAWTLLAVQLLSLVIGGVAEELSTPARPVEVDAGFSISGWLAVLLTFVLARVFTEGELMRQDLKGTI